MSDELERLKADLEVLQRHQGYSIMENAIADLADKIARLEAEADPWREAKVAVERFLKSPNHRSEVVVGEYIDHLIAKVEAQKKQIDYLHAEYENRGLHISELVAENDRLEKRVAELEAEPEYTTAVLKRADEIVVGDVILGSGMIRAVTNWARHSTEYRVQIMCDEWVSWFDPGNLIAVLRQPLVEAKTVADAEATKRPFEDPWLIRCRDIVQRLAENEEMTANDWWHLVVDAKEIWAEIQRKVIGAGNDDTR